MQWDEDLFSREGIGDHDAFALNHSCDPNVWMVDTFRLTARRGIAPGEDWPRAERLRDDRATAGTARRVFAGATGLTLDVRGRAPAPLPRKGRGSCTRVIVVSAHE